MASRRKGKKHTEPLKCGYCGSLKLGGKCSNEACPTNIDKKRSFCEKHRVQVDVELNECIQCIQDLVAEEQYGDL